MIVIYLGWLLVAILSLIVIYFDIKIRVIKNYHCSLIALACCVLFINFHALPQIILPLTILGAGVIFNFKGWFGGGDTKLFAAYSTAILPENLFITVLLILIIGGVVSLCCLIKNKWTKSADRGVPYGVAIVIGSLFGIWMSL
ncbi:A24 family peptidase [Vibrio owensii]|uniref:A24 family peptidase n=1 Tax=Vibrio owensii TaxID=696485 RepID=UPI00148E0B48|nr:prepilin peptidase [Vibrio owensii]